MGEGLAQVLTVGSIVLTVVSLTVAVVFARKRSRIRIGFDLTRAAVGVAAILVMAAITGVTTPGAAIALAIAVGLGLGFFQGSALEVSSGERGLYATRSPIGIVLWGAGIVIMQAAGLASRTGTVRVGQTIAWFSACLGIGLMAGRNGPLQNARKALAGGAAAMLVAVLLAPMLIAGTADPAVAQTDELAHSQVCDLIEAPLSPGLNPGSYIEDDEFFFNNSDVVLPTAWCSTKVWFLERSGQRAGFWVYYHASAEDAARHFVARRDETAERVSRMTETNIETISLTVGEEAWAWRMEGVDETVLILSPPFVLWGGAMDREGVETIPPYEQLLVPMAATVDNIEASPATEPPSDPNRAESSPPPPVDVGDGTDDADSGAGTDGSDGTVVAPPLAGDADEPVTPEKAAGQAIAGLIAAAAIGVITWAEAAAEIGRILGGLGSGGTSPMRTRTVVISGTDAEAIINGGPGSTVPIPPDQQSDLVASIPGEEPITAGRVGSVGIVRSVGPIVRGPDGSVSVSVEVDAFDPSPPPPRTGGPLLPEIDEIYVPSPDVDPVGARPPGGGPLLPEIDEIYEPSPDVDPVSARPPVDELPPEPPPVDEPPPDGDMPLDDEQSGDEPGGDEPESDEPGDELPDGPAPEVALNPREIDDYVRWGVERNRSPEDILQDLEGYNRSRGGTGPIELPEPLVQVDTPAGPVTVTAAEAARFDEAAAEVERLSRERAAIRGEMANLDNDAAWWGGTERFAGERLIAGTGEMSSRIMETGARIGEIDSELARLSRRPDPMVWDFQRAGMATREEAFASWDNRHSHGWHHDQIQQLVSERNELNSRLTQDLGEYRTTAADDVRLDNAREMLDGIEDGTRPPSRIDFETDVDPEEAYAAALEDWRTRDSSGRYYEEAQRLRAEIAERESLTHVSDVEPARPGDRGTAFDRPARELARIAEEQDRTMESYREIDRQIDAAQGVIDDIARRGNPD